MINSFQPCAHCFAVTAFALEARHAAALDMSAH